MSKIQHPNYSCILVANRMQENWNCRNLMNLVGFWKIGKVPVDFVLRVLRPFKWSRGGRGFTSPYFNFTLALICIVLIISLTNFNSLWTISTKSSSAESFSWSQQIHNHHPKLCHILTSKQIKIVYISIMDFGKNKTHNIICNLLILSLLILQHLTLLQHPH